MWLNPDISTELIHTNQLYTMYHVQKKHGDKENEWLVSHGETDFYKIKIESNA